MNLIPGRRALARFGATLSLLVTPALAASEPLGSAAILQELRNFRETGSVLYVAAHPDDENNRLLPYLARGRALRTAYLSLTRGDGGQNLIGPELGDPLGVIRTQELLAARRIDGARQFFTRARDFGFSKDSVDTLQRWDRQQVLGDIVRVIRTFRPDVVVTRFSTVPGGTHGHHTASAILAAEAFKLCGDPAAFPDQLAQGLAVWRPKRLVWDSFNRANFSADTTPGVLRAEANGYEPLLGESFGEIGARARTQHKSQGEGRLGIRGSVTETFQFLDGEPADKDILDGVDTTWARFPGGADIGPLADDLIAKFNLQDPAASVPALLVVHGKLAALPADPLLAEKRVQLERVLQSCLGLFFDTTIASAQAMPGGTLSLKHSAIARTGVSVRWLGVRYPSIQRELGGDAVALIDNQPASRESAQTLPASTPISHPYWLRAESTEAMHRVDDASLIGRPENAPVFPVEQIFEVGGRVFALADEPVQVVNDQVRGEIRRRLDVLPPVSLSLTQGLELFAPGGMKPMTVEVVAALAGAAGSVQLEVPVGWQVAPGAQDFKLTLAGDRARFTFNVTAPASSAAGWLTASAEVDGIRLSTDRVEIRYEHIPAQLLQAPARTKLVSLDLAIRGREVGYLPGAGDAVGECLVRMGYNVTFLANADLEPEKLSRFDAIVIGVRAFNLRPDLDQLMPVLFSYAEQGGTVIVQYSTSNSLLSKRIAPYDIKLSDDRVTRAAAPVAFLAPDHPALTGPNKITPADFDGWVQERARYIPRSWDSRFTPLIASGDPGEQPLRGTLLVARHGKGWFVYTGLSFFRELPAGVPGAYRLFANLLSLGKSPDPSRRQIDPSQ